jgi:hypothetical protein
MRTYKPGCLEPLGYRSPTIWSNTHLRAPCPPHAMCLALRCTPSPK